MKPSIFSYYSYRLFLKAWFEWKKVDNPHFSHRTFAQKANLPSHNYVMRLVSGERNLSESHLQLIAEGLKLNADETRYFELLRELERESGSEQKTAIFRNLLDIKRKHHTVLLSGDQLLFYEKWYYPLIWEMVVHWEYADDFAKIGKMCIPSLSEKEVREAVSLLISAGLLEKHDDGTYHQISPTLTTGDEIVAGVVRNYHRQHLIKSSQILDTIPPEQRDVSSVTVPASQESFLKMKKVIQDCRKQLLEIAASDPSPESVYLVGFQLIPQTLPWSPHE